MNRRRFCMAIGAATTGPLLNPEFVFAADEVLLEQSAKGFGTTVRLAVRHPSRAIAQRAIDRAFAELTRIESLMSIYRHDSQISQLNREGLLRSPDPTVVSILRRAVDYAKTTNGVFDITVQPLWELNRSASKLGNAPTQLQRKWARQRVGYQNVIVEQPVRLKNAAKITLNGIAQGFATDRARQVLQESGIKHALIDFGELACLGQKSTRRSWRAGIQHPRVEDAFSTVVALDERCLATSGDYQSSFTDDFKSHHVFDPRTGYSPTELASVSVLAATATEADVLSTACMVTGIRSGLQLLSEFTNADAMFIRKDGSVAATQGFPEGIVG